MTGWTLSEFLAHLRSLDVRLSLDGDRLACSAPKGALSAEIRAELQKRKPEILSFLSSAADADSFTPPPILPAAPGSELTLSYPQQRLWFLDRMEPGNPMYNISGAVRMTGTLDRAALEKSLQAIIQRHDSIRTVFQEADGAPAAVVTTADGWQIDVASLLSLPNDRRDAEMQRLAAAEVRRPFDLARGPMLRATLFVLRPAEHVLLLTMHHIASDGWSLGVFIKEFGEFYAAFHKCREPVVERLPIQYGDYAVWHRRWLESGVMQEQLPYWNRLLAGPLPVLELPHDRPRPPIDTHRGARISFGIPTALTEALKRFSVRENSTLFMTLLSGFQILLNRYSGQDDVIVGTAVANRDRPELADLMGFFVNNLVLRTDLSGNPTVRESISRTSKVVLDAFANQDVPFDRLVEILQPERSLNRSPLFQTMFVLQNWPLKDLELPDLHLSSVELDLGLSRFDLTVEAIEKSDRLWFHFEFNTDLFDATSIERMQRCYQTLLAAMVAEPERRIAELAMMPTADVEQITVKWNDTTVTYQNDACVHDLIEEQAARTPGAIAVVHGSVALTYADLAARANILARYLRALGIGRNNIVGVCMERSIEMVVALLGIMRAGAAYVPFDPEYPAERLRFMLKDTNASVVLTQNRLVEQLKTHLANTPHDGPQLAALDEEWESRIVSGAALAGSWDASTADDLAYMIYTSGSTGRPKGAMNTHRGVTNRLRWMQSEYSLTDRDVVLQKTPFSFDVSVWEFFWPLMTGARLVMAEPGGHRDPSYLIHLIRSAGVTVTHFVPSMLRNFLEHPDAAECSSLRDVMCSGEALPFELTERFFEKLPCTELHNLYGPTECAVDVSFWRCVRDDPRGMVPIGKPIANTQLYILDAAMRPVPIGVAGELHIGGVQVGRGYHNRPDLTIERFVTDPFSDRPESRLYKTGDLARWLPDGNIEYLGRIDNQVKLRGFRIELGEIESVLNEHESIQRAIVLAREDVPGDQRLVAYLVVSAYNRPSDSVLRTWLEDKLPQYMVPTAFVSIEALPLSPNGKIDRRALPAPIDSERDGAMAFISPRAGAESAVAKLWQAVLHVESVSAQDNFFRVGGHSLVLVQLQSRLRETFHCDISLMELYRRPTVSGMAEYIAMLSDRTSPPTESISPPRIVAAAPGAKLPLSFPQQRLWFLDRMDPGNPIYNIAGALRMTGNLNKDALEASVREIIARHESLRTVFQETHEAPIAVVRPVLDWRMDVVSLLSLPDAEREPEMLRLCITEGRCAFDLKIGPMLRATLIELEPTEHVLLLVMHHIASDGWSLGVLINELGQLYTDYHAQHAPSLPSLQIQYGDYSLWNRQWLDSSALQLQLPHWTKSLAAPLPILDLPFDHPRPALQTHNGRRVTFTISQELTEALKQLSAREGGTLFMTLLAGFQILLYRYSGQDDVIVGTAVANRNRPELEDLIGFFVNNLVLRTDLSGDPTVRECLSRVYQTTLSAFANQDVPFDRLVEVLRPERSLNRSPLFETMFILQNWPLKDLQLPELLLNAVDFDTGLAHYDLSVDAIEQSKTLRFNFEFNTDLFDLDSIERMQRHYETLLTAMVTDPEHRISELTLLAPEESKQLSVEWNDTTTPSPETYCVHQLVEQQALRTPNAEAVQFGEVILTYDEVMRRANQVAHRLIAMGVGPGTHVGICIERTADMIAALLGVWKAGGAYVPIDPAYPKDRIAFMMRDADLAALVVDESLRPDVPLPGCPVLYLDRDKSKIDAEPEAAPEQRSQPHDVAYMIYTSGSTGIPKGVLVEHRSVVNFLTAMRREPGLKSSDTLLAVTTLSFDIAGLELYLPLIVGARVVVLSRAIASDGLQLARAITENCATAMQATPATWRLLLESGWHNGAGLKALCGGEALPRTLADSLLNTAEVAELWNMYGPTETTIWSTIQRVFAPETEHGSSDAVFIGRPIDNTKLYVLDESRALVPINVAGELYIGGAGLARGYHNRPDLTAERFVANSFVPGERMYRTGDRVRYRANGTVEYLGRLDNQVKIRGFRIELGEVESVLAAHDKVEQAVVMVREDTPGDQRLVAYIVGFFDDPSVSMTLRAWLLEKLPPYMVPSAFVKLDTFPLTPNGKIDRRALPASSDIGQGPSTHFISPRAGAETTIATIWRSILQVENVGSEDNFFDLGGHSLLVVRLQTRLREEFDCELSLVDLFRRPTVSSLAEYISSRLTKPADDDAERQDFVDDK